MDELWQRYSSGEMLSADSLKNHNGGKRFTTNCKDTLYGGDGITPNVFVPLDTASMRNQLLNIPGNMNSFVYNYYLQHKAQIDQFATATDYSQRFNNNGEMWNALVQYTAKDSFNFTKVSSKEKELLTLRLKALLARYKWRNSGFYQVLNNDDPVIKKALENIDK